MTCLLPPHRIALRLAVREAELSRMVDADVIPFVVLPTGAIRFEERELVRWLATLRRGHQPTNTNIEKTHARPQ